MRMNWKKGQTTGFRAAALFAVLGATMVLAGQPDAEVRAPGDAVPLEEVVLVSKVAPTQQIVAGGLPLGALGGLLGGGLLGGGGGGGGVAGNLLGLRGLE